MSKGGSSVPDRQTTVQEPPSFLQPGLRRAAEEAERLFDTERRQFFPQSTVVGFAPQTEAALNTLEDFRFNPATQQGFDALAQRGATGSPLVRQSQQALTEALQGRGAFVDPVIDASTRDAVRAFNQVEVPGLAGTFNQAGRLGSGAFANQLNLGRNELARTVADNSARIRLQSQQQALAQALPFAQQDFVDAQALLSAGQGRDALNRSRIEDLARVGASRERLEQERLQEQLDRFNFSQNADQARLTRFLQNLTGGGNQGFTQTTSSPDNSNPFLSGAGGALTGAAAAGTVQSLAPSLFQGAVGAAGPQVPGALSALGGPTGLAIGAGLGLLGGLFG